MKTLLAIIRPPVGLSKYYTIKWASLCTTLLRPHVSYFTFSPSNGGKTRGGGRQLPPTFEGAREVGGNAPSGAAGGFDECRAEWSKWNVSLRLAVAPAWPAEPVGVAQPATRRMRARTPLVLVACIRLRRGA